VSQTELNAGEISRTKPSVSDTKPDGSALTSELLILPSGRILVHNLTPVMAALLAELNPADDAMRERAESGS